MFPAPQSVVSVNHMGSDTSFLICQDDYLYKLVMTENFDPLVKANITKLDKALSDINRLRKGTEPKKKKDSTYGKTTAPTNSSTKKCKVCYCVYSTGRYQQSRAIELVKPF